MSFVTGILIATSIMESSYEDEHGNESIDWIVAANAWIRENWSTRKNGRLIELDDMMSVGKHPQFYVAGGGYNYFPEEDFIKWLKLYPWEYPDEVIVILNPEHGALHIVNIKET